MRPAVAIEWLDAVLAFRVGRQSLVGSRNMNGEAKRDRTLSIDDALVIQHELSCRLVPLLRVAGDAAALQDRLDVAVVLDGRGRLDVAHSCFILGVPLLAGLIVLLAGEERR